MSSLRQVDVPPVEQNEIGPVGEFLSGLNVPYPSLLGSIVTFVVVSIVLYLVARYTVVVLVSRVLEARNVDAHARSPLEKLTKAVVVFAAIGLAFGTAGFGSFLQSFATIAAAATLALGFALQDVIQNFVAGIFIFTDRPFRTGDWIEWDEYSGTVEDISLRVTRVRTFDNELLTVPNSNLTDDVIKNPVDADRLRLQVLFGIGYDDDVEQATDIILEEADRNEDILAEPAPSVRLTELADSYVGLQSRIWIGNPSRSDFVRTKAEYITAVKARFDEEGIDIPYPQRELSGDLEFTGVEADPPAEPTD